MIHMIVVVNAIVICHMPVDDGRRSLRSSLVLEVELLKHSRGIWKYQARARVDGGVVAETELLCAVRPT